MRGHEHEPPPLLVQPQLHLREGAVLRRPRAGGDVFHGIHDGVARQDDPARRHTLAAQCHDRGVGRGEMQRRQPRDHPQAPFLGERGGEVVRAQTRFEMDDRDATPERGERAGQDRRGAALHNQRGRSTHPQNRVECGQQSGDELGCVPVRRAGSGSRSSTRMITPALVTTITAGTGRRSPALAPHSTGAAGASQGAAIVTGTACRGRWLPTTSDGVGRTTRFYIACYLCRTRCAGTWWHSAGCPSA